jgi:hypothetical protein
MEVTPRTRRLAILSQASGGADGGCSFGRSMYRLFTTHRRARPRDRALSAPR